MHLSSLRPAPPTNYVNNFTLILHTYTYTCMISQNVSLSIMLLMLLLIVDVIILPFVANILFVSQEFHINC